MNTTPNALAPHSGGSLLPYIIVGFGDDTWGIMDSRSGHYAMFLEKLRLWSKPSWAEDWVQQEGKRPSADEHEGRKYNSGFPLFAPLLLDGQPRKRDVM